ncbi:serine hydrolase [Devosia sp. A16]|uniref:serine hydrolase n=1 Tax=Devosia sp. A16 TaxID=1736675 RepID=UPI0006D7C049|nr:serine hydrolase [Devosia sp. A16]
MKAVLTALAATLLPTSAALAQSPSNAAIAEILVERIDAAEQNVGIAVAVIENGAPRFVFHGQPQLGATGGIDEHTVFEIGSVTKLFTNVLLAQEVLAGTIDLDAPIVNYLPRGTALPERGGRQITAFDLVTHSSGLPPVPPDLGVGNPANPYAGYGAEPLRAFLESYQVPRDIGTEFEYSNIGLALVAEAVEQVTGKDYASLLEERIFTPLKMTETALTTTPELRQRLASGHDAARNPVSNWDLEVFAGAGALRSTVADVSKFIAAASGAVSTPLDPAFALMLERTRPSDANGGKVGLGWFTLAHPKGEIAWHNGMTGGYNAFVGYDRQSRKGVVVLSNMASTVGIEDIGFHILADNLPLAAMPKLRQPVALDPALLDRYVGRYALTPAFVLEVTREGDALFVQATGQQKLPVFAETETTFFYKAVDAQLSFELGPDGRTTSLTLHQNGLSQPAKRIDG